MISRVADHCFWLGRYLERADNTARVLQVTQARAFSAEVDERTSWHAVIVVAGEEERFAAPERDAEMRTAVLDYMTWYAGNPTSLVVSVRALRENARSMRETISREAWESINELYLWMDSADARAAYARQPYDLYQRVLRTVATITGILRSTMLHDEPLEFIRLGAMLERAGQSARIIDVQHHVLRRVETVDQVVDTALWLALLRACSGYEPFMRRHRGRVTGEAVAAFLVFEPKFPRSIQFSLTSAWERLLAIRPPEEAHLPGAATAARIAGLRRWLDERRTSALAATDVHPLCTHVVEEVHDICVLVGEDFLGYAKPTTDEGTGAAA
jgi:uncharacterized alpha-E superfamily protein